MMKIWLGLLLIPLFSFAKCPTQCDQKSSFCLEGIVVVDAGANFLSISRKQGVSIQVSKLRLKGLKKVLAPYLCGPLDQSVVQNIKDSVIDYFQKEDILAMAIIPVQEVTDGILILEILSSKIGTISFEGQEWFPESLLEKKISLKEGELLDQNALLNDLAFLNRNPFHKTELILFPGKETGMTSLEFLTHDRFPARFYVGGDNTGVQTIDKIRLFGGVNCGNAFGIGDLFSYQYTAAPDFHRFQSHVVSYNSYLPWKHTLLVYGSYGEIHPDIIGFRSEGKSAQGSARYQWLMQPLYRPFRQHVEFGLDYKYLNSNLFFVGTLGEFPITVKSINITQLQGAYSLSNYWDQYQITLRVEGYVSPWKDLLPNQTDADYQVLRPQSHVRYAYLKTAFGYRYTIANAWDMSLFIRGQAASGPLPASEQFSLGGLDTIRGYEQTQFLADNAICSNLELFFPVFSTKGKIRSKTTILGFWDFGYGFNYKEDDSPDIEEQLLSGVGMGLRFQIPPHFFLVADYGFRLTKIPGGSAPGRFYLSATLSY